MKKSLFLPLLIIAAVVSNSWANDCTQSGYSYIFCGYGSGCFKLNTVYSDAVSGVCTKGNCSCDQLIAGCLNDNGGLYGGNSVPSLIADEPYGNGHLCTSFGSTINLIEGSTPCGTYCQWASGCHSISFPDSENPTAANCAALEANCAANSPSGQYYTTSTCGGTQSSSSTTYQSSSSIYTDPILRLSNTSASNMLSAMQNAVNLQVKQGSSTSFKIFDMKGTNVHTVSFSEGNYVVSLSYLPRGMYIVQATNASWKQTVKVTVK